MPETETGGAKFRVWLRRRAEESTPYSVRFEVTDGKGILRVARPGVLVDPPARPFGFEERLSAAQVRASRFLHVWDGGRYRQGYMLARLEEARMDALPADRWIQLEPTSFGVNTALLLPALVGPTTGEVDEEPTWPRRDVALEAALAAAVPDASEPMTEVRRSPVEPDDPPGEVALPRSPVYAQPPRAFDPDAPRSVRPIYSDGPRTEVRGEHRAEPDPRSEARAESTRTQPPRLLSPVAEVRPRPASPFDTLDSWVGGNDDDDRTQVMSGSALAVGRPPVSPALPHLPMVPASQDAGDEMTMIEAFDGAEELDAMEAGFVPDDDEGLLEAHPDEDEDPDAIPALDDMSEEAPRRIVTVMPEAAFVAAPAVAAQPAMGAREVAPVERSHEIHERNTTLVRHLRRQIAKDREEIAALEHRVRSLETELARRR